MQEKPKTGRTTRAAATPRGLRLIAAFKLFKGLVLFAVGIGAAKLLHKHMAFEFERWADMFRVDPQQSARRPAKREEKLLGEPPPKPFVRALRERGVSPIAVGRVIVATWKPHETSVLEVIRDLGLELHVTFNKDAVMVLPTGLSKATGLAEALRELGLSAHNVVGISDAENDHAFLRLCECRIAVANALPMLKDAADLVTRHDHGAGVRELIDRLIDADLRDLEPSLEVTTSCLASAPIERRYCYGHGSSVLLVGSSGSGKSTLAAGVLERLADCEYQFCVVDPEGDYSDLPEAIV